jgi:hypothetical protein
VVTLAIANHKIHRILVDTGSSTDILYKSAFELTRIDQDKMTPARCPMVGFTSESVLLIGSIKLPVMEGTFPRQQIVMAEFVVVDRPLAYNV